jgi:hypothetical protein
VLKAVRIKEHQQSKERGETGIIFAAIFQNKHKMKD